MKLLSWNVNGIRAAVKKGFLEYLEDENPDIICIQETKAHPEQVDLQLLDYPYQYWNSAEKKGYSGTAIFSKIEPLAIKYGLGIKKHDLEGRVITAEFNDYFLVTVYTPNSKRELLRNALVKQQVGKVMKGTSEDLKILNDVPAFPDSVKKENRFRINGYLLTEAASDELAKEEAYKKYLAAYKIQQWWKHITMSPHYAIGRKFINKKYDELFD